MAKKKRDDAEQEQEQIYEPIKYHAKLTGITSAKMHRDDVPSADAVKAWRDAHKKDIGRGDDRFPSWTWKTYLYHDGTHVTVPTDNIVACLRNVGSLFSLGGGQKTLKSASVSCLSFPTEHWRLIPAGKTEPILIADCNAIDDRLPFAAHAEPAAKLGMILDVRRVSVGQSKHVRARPCFPTGWTTDGEFYNLRPDLIPEEQLRKFWVAAGEFAGLLDWRPSSDSPGWHGKFTVELSRVG